MAFGMRIEQPVTDRRVRPSADTIGPLAAIAIAVVAFCIYDYSSYGHGYVAAFLGEAQRWFQRFIGSFRLKM